MNRAVVGAFAAGLCMTLALPVGSSTAQESGKDRPKKQERQRQAVDGAVRLVPRTPEPLQVKGLHRYLGTIVIDPATDGLVVVDRLSLERYLLGLNEVPFEWPMEALRAQAVAARTYALNTLERPRAGAAAIYGFDICASVECQVFSGADQVLDDPDAARWNEAVRSTADVAVLYQGRPILARYHSTSGGQTFANETIFTDEGPFPYLKGVESVTEQGSPLYRWRVTFRFGQLTRLLERAGLWAGKPIEKVRTVSSSEGKHYPDLVFSNDRARRRMSAETFRVAARTFAPEMFPLLYPSIAPTPSGRLPEPLPSNRYVAFTDDGFMRIVGRGWGHGVGMSQWGAEGLARRGFDFAQILHHYYTGVTVARYDGGGRIDVGVAWQQPKVVVGGSFDVLDPRGRVVRKVRGGSLAFNFRGPGTIGLAGQGPSAPAPKPENRKEKDDEPREAEAAAAPTPGPAPSGSEAPGPGLTWVLVAAAVAAVLLLVMKVTMT